MNKVFKEIKDLRSLVTTAAYLLLELKIITDDEFFNTESFKDIDVLLQEKLSKIKDPS